MNKMTNKHDDILSLYEIYLDVDASNFKSGDLQYLDIDLERLGDYLTTCHGLDLDHPLMKLVQKVKDTYWYTEEDRNEKVIKSVKELIEELRGFNDRNKWYEESYKDSLSHDWEDFHNTLQVTKELVDKGELDKVKTNLDHLEYISQFMEGGD